MAQTVFGAAYVVAAVNRAFTNTSLGNAVYQNNVAEAGTTQASQFAYAAKVGANYAGMTDAALAAQVLSNMGVTATADLTAALTSAFAAAGTASRGIVVLQLANLLSSLETATGTLAVYNAPALAWNKEVEQAYVYSSNTANTASSTGDVSVTAGQTFTLTTNSDNITGTAGDDTVNAVAGTGATLSAGDVINGGAGTDTLRVVTDGAFTVVGANVTGFEKLSVIATGAANVTLSAVSGLTELVNTSSSAAVTFGQAAGGVSAPTALTINGATAATSVVYADTALVGTADAQVVNLTGYGTTAAQTLTIGAATAAANELESLTINSLGTAKNQITLTTDGTQTSLKTITVTGDAALTLAMAADNIVTSATTINASATTGGVTVASSTTTLGAAAHNVTLGSGNDTVFFGANLNGSDTVVGGAGTDTLGVSAAVSNTIMANVSGFEVVRFNVAGGSITQDAGITSLAGMNYAVSGANTLTLNNAANNTTTTVVGDTTTLTEVLKDATGLSDALTVVINNGASNAATTLGTLTNVTGLETLNLTTGGGTGTNVITTDSVAAKHVITGSANLTITNALAATQVDATGMTGKLTVTAGTSATNIQSGSGADTITLSTAADTVNAGAGNDTISLGAVNAAAGADVLYGGAGNDTFVLANQGLAATATDYTTLATIKDFTVGTSTTATDFIKLSDTGVYNNATGLAAGTGATGSVASGDAAVIQTVAQNAATAASSATANIIKLSTGVAFTTNFQTTFNNAIGTATVTGVAADSVHAVVFYDTTNSKAVLATVISTAGTNTVIESGDTVMVVGAIDMSAADYAALSAVNFANFG